MTGTGTLTICDRDGISSDVLIDGVKVGLCRPAPARTSNLCPRVLVPWGSCIAESHETTGNVYIWHMTDEPTCYQCDFAAEDALKAIAHKPESAADLSEPGESDAGNATEVGRAVRRGVKP